MDSLPAEPQGSPRILGSPVDFPDPGIEPGSPALQADSLATELSGKPWNPENFRSNDGVKKPNVIGGLPWWSSG